MQSWAFPAGWNWLFWPANSIWELIEAAEILLQSQLPFFSPRNTVLAGDVQMLHLRDVLNWGVAAGVLLSITNCGGGASAPSANSSLSIVTTPLADGMVSFSYNQNIQSTGGTAPFAWSVVSGTLPHNLALGNATTNTVSISGTPDTAQLASFTIQVEDSKNRTSANSYTLNINSARVVRLQPVASAPSGIVEFQGVSAGPFNPMSWQQGTLNWVPDVRSPMFAPQTSGPWRNIYSPWPLPQPNGWLLFYGGWDGSDTPNDREYNVATPDFLSFGGRSLVIDHGVFQHVNNVNVSQLADGSMHMICTVLPNSMSLDKPAYFSSPDGLTWNGSSEPYSAQSSDVVQIAKDNLYAATDYNGGNVLLWDNNAWTLYYSSGLAGSGHSKVFRATGTSPPQFQNTGSVLDTSHYADDVHKFQAAGEHWYLMALYTEASTNPALYYSLSNDGLTFGSQHLLFTGTSSIDQNLETPAFVISGGSIFGVLYGGYSNGPCCTSQIFGRWLQKTVSITDSSGTQYTLQGGYGPDRQWFQAQSSGVAQASVTIYAEDGVTPLAKGTANISGGQSYQVVIQ